MTSIDIHDPANHTLEGFRAFFASIDESLYCCGTRGFDDTSCALGHIERRVGRVYEDTIGELFRPLLATFTWVGGSEAGYRYDRDVRECPRGLVAQINNGNVAQYQQPTPRARILAAIDDLIALRDSARATELDALERRALVPFELPVASLS